MSQYGMVEGDGQAIIGYDVDGTPIFGDETVGLSLRNILMPHTVVTDRMGRDALGRKNQQRPNTNQARQPVFVRPPLPAMAPSPTSLLGVPIGIGIATWTGTNTDTINLEVEPQVNFRPKRLIIDVGFSAATAAIVVVRNITVGVTPQLPATSQPIPSAMFRPDATVSQVSFQVVDKGIKFTVQLGVTAAPGSGITVTAVVGAYGDIVL